MAQITDERALQLEQLWKELFPDALIIPVIGYPSIANGVMSLTHTVNTQCFKIGDIEINGLVSKSPIMNNALFSTEVSDDKYITLYEVVLPDIPGKNGNVSTVQYYIDNLQREGIKVAATHYNWTGVGDPFLLAIHSYSTTLAPECFVQKTLCVLNKTLNLINKRRSNCSCSC